MRCINCGRLGVRVQEEHFVCDACKYVWDEAHEQANAVYLESQRRKPATISRQTARAAPDLLEELGITEEGQASEDEATHGELLTVLLDEQTVSQLEDLADKAGVDLSGARLKEDKIAVLVASDTLEFDAESGAVWVGI